MEEGRTRTVLMGDGRDPDRYLRVTWHAESRMFVFSHWHGSVCAASTSVPLSEVSGLAELLGAVLRTQEARQEETTVMRLPQRLAATSGRSGSDQGGE